MTIDIQKNRNCWQQLLVALKFLSFILLVFISLVSCSGDGDGLDANGQPLSDNLPVDDNFGPVQEIFTSRCIACHAGAAAPQGLILTDGLAFDALVSVPSTQIPELDLVTPGDAEQSYLVQKVRGDSTIVGGQMPRNGPPFLSTEQINTIIDWVNDGAPAPSPVDPNAEFIADLSNFTNYSDWESIDYSTGQTNDALSTAHQGENDSFSRRVFQNPTAIRNADGTFPNGSIFVKETVTFENGSREFPDANGITAMVKRGAGFNPDHGDWEWFVLSDDLSEIVNRGADVGMCGACHQQAQSQTGGGDFVFPHPSEIVLESDSFAGYTDWTIIDDRTDANPLLDDMAHGAPIEGTRRIVYQRPLYANPDTETQGYPVGTKFVKETYDDGALIEITAMVKRGGDFNSANNYWEWFILDTATGNIALDDSGAALRGADLMNGMCNGCHFAANTVSGNGIDYVFKHPGAPFNNDDEFFAELSSFADYQQWEVVDYTIGDINPAIGAGHQGQVDLYSRRTYANELADNADGAVYPRGSIFIKEVTTWETGDREFSPQLGLVAMVKRGGNFNTDNGGWEWFELENDNSGIIGRGGDYRNNGCNNCHTLANTQDGGFDYVFQHPSEFAATSNQFSDYQSWTLIDERSDQNPLLGGMAHKGGDPDAIRRVYKKQLYAAPEDAVFGFPIGTTIVKEVTQDNVVTELAAMVKRGSDFNAEHQNWEWFVLDPADASILTENGAELRGGDLMNGMCNSCHALAEAGSENGTDYVFFHEGDPLNNNEQ